MKAILALAAITVALSACTPEQLATYSDITGQELSDSDQAALLPLPDRPMTVGAQLVMPDGSVVDDPVAVVNGLTYNHGDPGPAMQAYRLVAAARGWTPAEIASWEIAIANIMMGESGFCPNLLGGARLASAAGCVVARQGSRSDAGFGQLISLHHTLGPNGAGWLCRQEGICGRWGVIATPWTSMTSLLALLERSGVQGWCYNATARSYHRIACSNPGLDV